MLDPTVCATLRPGGVSGPAGIEPALRRRGPAAVGHEGSRVVGQWVWGNTRPARYFCTKLLPMAARILSPCAEMVFRCQMLPAQVPVLKNSRFDLMTRFAFIPRTSAEPKQSTNRRDDRRTGKSVRPLGPAARPKTSNLPTWGRDTN